MLQAADLTIRLHPNDDVVIARGEIPSGTLVTKESVRAAALIPAGHKLAVRDVAQGKPVKRYNQIIGFATRPIRAGEHVHVHNLAMGEFEKDYAFCADVKPIDYFRPAATFQGIAAWKFARVGASWDRPYRQSALPVQTQHLRSVASRGEIFGIP